LFAGAEGLNIKHCRQVPREPQRCEEAFLMRFDIMAKMYISKKYIGFSEVRDD